MGGHLYGNGSGSSAAVSLQCHLASVANANWNQTFFLLLLLCKSISGDVLIHALSYFLCHTHTHPHSEMLGGPSVLWASSSSSSSVVFMPTGSLQPGCERVCPQASELGPGPGSGPGPVLLVWGMVYTLEESADIQYLAPRARGLPEWCEPLTRQQRK